MTEQKAKMQVQKFRLRGFKPTDGTEDVILFGNDAAPTNADGTPMAKLWDQDHEHHIIVTNHVETPTQTG